MRCILLRALMVAALWSSAVAAVADDSDEGVVVQLVSIRVAPGDVERWEEGVRSLVAAARTAKLSDQHDWLLYREGMYQYSLVLFSEGLGELDTPRSFSEALAGTDGKPAFVAGVEMLRETRYEVLRIVVTQQVYE